MTERGRGRPAGETDGVWQQRVEAGLAAFLDFVAEHPEAARMCDGRGALGDTAPPRPATTRRCTISSSCCGSGTPGGDRLPETLEETLVGGVAWIVSQQIRRGGAEEAIAHCCPNCRSSCSLRTTV